MPHIIFTVNVDGIRAGWRIGYQIATPELAPPPRTTGSTLPHRGTRSSDRAPVTVQYR